MEHHLLFPWKHDALARKWLARAIWWVVVFFVGVGIGNLSTDHGYPKMTIEMARHFAQALIDRHSVSSLCIEPEYVVEDIWARYDARDHLWWLDYKVAKPGFGPGRLVVHVEESGAAYWRYYAVSDDLKKNLGERPGLCPEKKRRTVP